MYVLYSFCLSLLFITLLPYFLYQSLRHGKYSESFRQRLGRLPDAAAYDGRTTIWVHAVSVGEFLAARVLIEKLISVFPNWRVVVSTTTLTGQRLAQAQPAGADSVFYFPFDWAFASRRALNWVKPRAVILLETELWPNFLRECRRRSVLAILANGRISRRSFSRYKKVRWFISRVVDDLSLLVMQSAADVTCTFELGAEARRVRLCGNLKYDFAATCDSDSSAARLLGLDSGRRLIIAGSTAPGEEGILLSAFRRIRTNAALKDVRLLIAPRHPERFEEVAALIARSGFSFVRRDGLKSGTDAAKSSDIVLLDSIGELAGIYRYGSVVFVGGSLVRRGGHNVIEPAASARPIIVGPHTENFRQIVRDLVTADAIVQIKDDGRREFSRLATEIARLLTDQKAAAAMGERALEWLTANRGAADCTIQALKEVLGA